MDSLHRRKERSVILTILLLLASLTACGSSKAASMEAASTADQLYTESTMQKLHSAQADVILPEDFDNMYYPIEAVAVEEYTQGLHYYPDGGDDTSFWFSMAVLSSLLSQNECIVPNLSDDFMLFCREDIDCMASALYADYASGKVGLAEITDEDPYVYYEEESEQYGLLNGNVGELDISIQSVYPTSQGYILGTQLMDLESNNVITEYQITIERQKTVDSCGLFSYSISGVTSLTSEEEEDDSITEQEALSMAKNYMDGNRDYSYKRMVTIGSYEYFDFCPLEESEEGPDILVCLDGSDVLTGLQNTDGSWTIY